MELLLNLATKAEKLLKYYYKRGLIKYIRRLFIGSGYNSTLRTKIIKCMHESLIGGHSWNLGTYQTMKIYFFLPGMKRKIKLLVQSCDIYKTSKSENCKYPRLLCLLPVPEQAWQHVSMDFIDELPKSIGAEVIMIVINKCTKYGHFISLSSYYYFISLSS
ncbi:hypothetical protein ACH5RR_029091 [Cinchona calisaya]|uniref:Integrase zinc-binding domain-containing protein n=1 Tax=Cinchona calisaya TaxID=153742 RepID=A0ABD2YQN5_9GENT